MLRQKLSGYIRQGESIYLPHLGGKRGGFNNKRITSKQPKPAQAMTRLNDIMSQAGQAANEAAARVAFQDHTARKADHTLRRKRADIALGDVYLLPSESEQDTDARTHA